MEKTDDRPGSASSATSTGQAVRQRAEEIAREQECRSGDDVQASSLEDTQRKLHELLVHQIELDMQNDELRRAQMELEESRERYIHLYDLAPVGYCTLSGSGLIQEINLTAAGLLGVPRSALIHARITNFILKEDQDSYYMLKQHLIRADERRTVELRMVRNGRIPFWAQLVASTVEDAKGVLNYRVILSDITERKTKQEELDAAQRNIFRQNTILSAINLIHKEASSVNTQEELWKACLRVVESATGSKFTIIGESGEDKRMDATILSTAGWGPCKMLDEAGHWKSDFDDAFHILFDRVLQSRQSVLENGPFEHSDSIGAPQEQLKPTAILGVPFFYGRELCGVIAVGNRAGGYRNEDQKLLEALVPTIMEVIRRQKAEETLREKEHLLRAIIEGTDDPVFLENRDGIILVANTATERKLGSSVHGKSAFDLYPNKEQAEAVVENDRRIMEEDMAQEVEETTPSTAGDRTYIVKKTPWHDSQGKAIGLISIARDITDRKNMEMELRRTAEELERKDRLVTDFFINISHELKTPITLIMIALEIVENYLKQPKPNREGLIKRTAIMKQNVNRLSRLVGNILDITKIDAGFMEPKFATIDMVGLIRNIVNSMESFASKRGLKIECNSSAEYKFMPADSQMIERILLNLVSNAIKHTPEGGSIVVECSDREGMILITVQDDGEGIPEEKKAIIFDRFRQVNTSMARSSEGSGIGLSLIKALVDLLGGRIWFESTLGKGSIFYVEIPVMQMEGQHQPIVQQGMTIDRRIELEFSDI